MNGLGSRTYPKGILKNKNQDGRRKVVVPGGRVPRSKLNLDSPDRNDSLKLGFTKAMHGTPLGNLKDHQNFFKELSKKPGSKTSNDKETQRTDNPSLKLSVPGEDGVPALDLLEEEGFLACRAFDENGNEEPQQPRKVIEPRKYETAVQREIRLTAERAGSATPTPSNDQPNEQRGLYSGAPPQWDNFAGP